MKKFFLILSVLAINNCFAATGNASDGELFSLTVILMISFILGTGYFIDFIKSKIYEERARRWMKRNMGEHEGETVN